MLTSILAICMGASAGALLRWFFNSALNWIFPAIPPGTLAVNLLGGWLMGIAVAFFALHPLASPQWKLMAITGFLGSLTTFSAFSGEMGALLQQGRLALCAVAICLHVAGSIGMFFLGLATFRLIRKFI